MRPANLSGNSELLIGNQRVCFESCRRRIFMHRAPRFLASLLLGSALMLPLATLGCVHHYHDNWNSQETVYYNQWVTENHRDPHVDYQHLSKEDQKRYWDWRHSHDHQDEHQ
jgi:hypothetical protein